MSGTGGIRLLLADDEVLIREALAALLALEPDFAVVGQASDGSEAVELAHRLTPDVVVLDLEMPVLDGIEAAMRIAAGTDAATVIVTRHARPAVLRRALTAGVRGFVPKTTPAQELSRILREVHAGGRYVDSEIAASALTENACPLTDRELEVLRHARDGGTVATIAARVHLAPGTVRNYLSSAITTLGVSTRAEAARRAWDEGWI
ncbi:response regulator transcription factor [Motilibacter aurantiacus]|uniref:response regulator transcription factor n=1 Tax=Motilibacter aurantiacus TaxID=2714955 RepID=UPI00140C362D|nr:response regulator transcription factor [Motilibacter aurantiacus]NHC43805.1 response regulator transcription factor [Motilibacter aurantiacus]